MSEPENAPPSYAQATGSSTASDKPSRTTQSNPSSKLEVPGGKNGIPTSARRSMEDERRPLPPGWVRQWDAKEQHQFFVDTKSDPPRSIWHHPHDDAEFLKTLSSEERERIQEQERDLKDSSAHLDLTDDEAALPPRPDGKSSTKPPAPGEKKTFGRKWKDKITGSTHEEREAERARRAEEERRYYESHLKFREAMQRAQATGQPQFFAKDRDGKDIYIEPPQVAGGYGGGYGGYGGGAGYGYSPYSSGMYANPNARFIRPSVPYGRPYGGGYGGGLGMPLAGGLMGGMLLGGLLF